MLVNYISYFFPVLLKLQFYCIVICMYLYCIILRFRLWFCDLLVVFVLSKVRIKRFTVCDLTLGNLWYILSFLNVIQCLGYCIFCWFVCCLFIYFVFIITLFFLFYRNSYNGCFFYVISGLSYCDFFVNITYLLLLLFMHVFQLYLFM